MKWNNFKKVKPTEKKDYLWAWNNWESRNVSGQRVHNYSVQTARWDGNEFWDKTGHSLYNPDEWAEVPYPKPAERPTDDIVYQV